MTKKIIRNLNFALLFVLFAISGPIQSLNAQPPFGRPGGDPRQEGSSRSGFGRSGFGRSGSGDRGSGSPFGGRGGFSGRPGFGSGSSASGFRGFDPTAMLKRFDRNGDGKIDPNELDERTRGFAGRMLERMGFDPKKPVSINEISKKIEERRGQAGEPQKDPAAEKELAKNFGIPGFSDVDEELPPLVPDFFVDPNSPVLLSGSLESRYEKSIIDQVNRTLQRYDRNRDGVLQNDEIRQGRFTSPPVEQSDLDRDGKLTKAELAERYVARSGGRGRIEKGKSKKSTSRSTPDSSSGSSRGFSFRFGRRGDERRGDERREGERKEDREDRKSDRSSDSRKSSSSTRSYTRRSSSSGSDKIVRYAKSILSQNDVDKDGFLSKDECENIKSVSMKSDTDGDGKVSLDELMVVFGAQPGSSASRRSKDNRNNPYLIRNDADKNAEADRDFRELDKNVDGQIQMHEFAKSWTDEIAEQFIDLDQDNNGVVTLSEWTKGGGLRSSRSRSGTGSSSRYSRSGR